MGKGAGQPQIAGVEPQQNAFGHPSAAPLANFIGLKQNRFTLRIVKIVDAGAEMQQRKARQHLPPERLAARQVTQIAPILGNNIP